MALNLFSKIKALFKKSPKKTSTAKVASTSKPKKFDGFEARRQREENRRVHSSVSTTSKPLSKKRTKSEAQPKSTTHSFARPLERRERKERRQLPARKPRESRFDYTSVYVENGDWTQDKYDVPEVEGKKRFHDFNLPAEIMHAICDLGFKYCTPIQACSLEQAMSGANVAGRAQTGTGKTAAYLVAILTRFMRNKNEDNKRKPRAIVIAPTRELCVQICRDAQALGKYCNIRSVAIFGGTDYLKQASLFTEGTDLIAATPGRLIDFMHQHIIDVSKVDTLVIDEADRMLDMGFIPDVRRIVSALPTERQTLLYSATLNEEVMRLAAQWMPNPVRVEIEPEKTANQSIEQKVFIVRSDEKFTILCHLLDRYEGQRVLVFANRRVSTDNLAIRLKKAGYPCELLSGEVSQNHRMSVIESFREGTIKLVVATDVAGRGLHIADIGLVVNFELPYEAEDYVHRIGRTGRAGQVGTAVSFADENESFIIPEIEKYIGEEIKCSMPEEDLLLPLKQKTTEAPPLARRERHNLSKRNRFENILIDSTLDESPSEPEHQIDDTPQERTTIVLPHHTRAREWTPGE